MKAGIEHRIGGIVLEEDKGILRSSNIPNKYELISEVDLLDPVTKQPLLDYPCWAAPVLAHGLMYLRGEDRLVCVELIPKK